jgi:hypothetical protein
MPSQALASVAQSSRQRCFLRLLSRRSSLRGGGHGLHRITTACSRTSVNSTESRAWGHFDRQFGPWGTCYSVSKSCGILHESGNVFAWLRVEQELGW